MVEGVSNPKKYSKQMHEEEKKPKRVQIQNGRLGTGKEFVEAGNKVGILKGRKEITDQIAVQKKKKDTQQSQTKKNKKKELNF